MDGMNKFADKLIDYLNGAEIFVKTQVPDFVTQFVAYQKWRTEWEFAFWIGVFSFLVFLQVINFLWYIGAKKDDSREPEANMFLCLMIGAVGTGSLFACIDTYASLKKLEIAPKVFMVEQAKKLLPSVCK